MLRADEIFGAVPARPNDALRLAEILHDLRAYLRKYVVLNDDQANTVTLWTAHTHVIDAADCTAYLQVGSATKRSGKTRLLETLEPVVARPWFTGRNFPTGTLKSPRPFNRYSPLNPVRFKYRNIAASVAG